MPVPSNQHRECVLLLMLFLVVGGSALAAVPPPRFDVDTSNKTYRRIPALEFPESERQIDIKYNPNRVFPEDLKYGANWQQAVQCGPNALFVLCRLLNMSVTRDEVLSHVPLTDAGSNLADLSKAAQAIGLSHELRKVSQKQVMELPVPFIVHENIRSPESPSSINGHFYVVVGFLPTNQIGIVDGISGTYSITDLSRLDRSFSGYVLVPGASVSNPTRWLWRVVYAVAAAVAGLAIVYVVLAARSNARVAR